MTDITIDEFARSVALWHEDNWPEPDPMMLAVPKVGEEAGEFLGAFIKSIEGRPGVNARAARQAVLDELGDVMIAAAAAIRRLNELWDTSHTLGGVAVTRWASVSERRYGGQEEDQ